MPQSPAGPSSNTSSTAPSDDLGANEWLVEEMREQYAKDPSSVTPEWATYFGSSTSPAPTAPVAAPTPAAPAAPASPNTPAPKATPRPPVAAAEPARSTTTPVAKETKPSAPAEAKDEPTYSTLRGIPAATAKNMGVSLSVPTATSVRNIPVKLLWDNRTVINNHLKRARGGKVSFTHLIGYALVRAMREMPEMNNTFAEVDGKPTLVSPAHVNLGLAIDQQKPDGTRQLVAPSIKGCESMDFAAFWTAYEDIVTKARDNKLSMEDYSGTTISLTNVGGLGTSHSVPRLMAAQAAIFGVGSMEYPPEYQGASEDTLTRNAVSKIMTITSTYDHRVIQARSQASTCAVSTTCCWVRATSTTRSSPACGSPTSRSAGVPTSPPATTRTSPSRRGSWS